MQRELRARERHVTRHLGKGRWRSTSRNRSSPRSGGDVFSVRSGRSACALAGIGLYAVVAFAVSRRSREIGIRMALGARSQQVVWTVAREVACSSVLARARASTLTLLAILASGPSPSRRRASRCIADGRSAGAACDRAFMAMVALAAAYVPRDVRPEWIR
jgi:hypothetical protein